MEVVLTKAEAAAMTMDEYTDIVNRSSRLVVDGFVVKGGAPVVDVVDLVDMGRWVDEGVGITPKRVVDGWAETQYEAQTRRATAERVKVVGPERVSEDEQVRHWQKHFGNGRWLNGEWRGSGRIGTIRYRLVVEMDYAGDGAQLEKHIIKAMRGVCSGMNASVNGKVVDSPHVNTGGFINRPAVEVPSLIEGRRAWM